MDEQSCDPDIALTHIRGLLTSLHDAILRDLCGIRYHVEELDEHFLELDHWLSRGGRLPRAWTTPSGVVDNG